MIISGAPCSWGVDDVKNPYLPDWKCVLSEAKQAGYNEIELGPYGYFPLESDDFKHELKKNQLSLIAGTIFDNLVLESKQEELINQTHAICKGLVDLQTQNNKSHPLYLVIIDWGHDERDLSAGLPEEAPRLDDVEWNRMVTHITEIAKVAKQFGVRPVIHPHAGGYIEFSDELERIVKDIPNNVAGLCLDTGHLFYSKQDPAKQLYKYASRLDYIHFKDIQPEIYSVVINEKTRFFEACEAGVMCPIGKGTLDYGEIFSVLNLIDYQGFITVEQERDPKDIKTSLDDMKNSTAFLVHMRKKVENTL
ncbi:TIM barrel protein [Shouchella sp. 1P09AA]|uniref:TIM barrel protein n=1 Tax=unclassified Shouchella TaxID=2893065 RepID=UPI00399FB066